jgi:alkylation response protein AidB-like acyl-CoA dehydrogenase
VNALAEEGLLGLSTPREHGGLGAPPEEIRRGLEIVASGCGTTAFVYFQHLVGCRHIAAGENAELASRVLPAYAGGDRFCTLAFSHLRRPGPPTLRVAADGDAFVFDGAAPWATGAGIADDVLLAGTDDDGSSIWVVVPLADGPGMRVSEPMPLAAANASATVSLACDGLRVGRDAFVKRVSPAQLAGDTAGAILFFTALSLGVAVAAAALVAERTAGTDVLAGHAAGLSDEIERARSAVDVCAGRAGETGFDEQAVAVRAWCVDLGMRAAHAAVVASGGRANLAADPAQRLLREAMLYTLTAQTLGLRAASLRRLSERAER